MNKKQQKKYEEFMLEQMRILHGHFNRCMLKCLKKLHKLEKEKGK